MLRGMETTQNKPTRHSGTCHCGAVRFEVEVDASAGSRCNCSVCTKVGATTGIVGPAAFVLHTDEATLGAYGGQTGRRFFCKQCGVTCYSRGHLEVLGGDYVSVNFNCLDDIDLRDVAVVYWDGRHNNWQAGPRDTPWPVA